RQGPRVGRVASCGGALRLQSLHAPLAHARPQKGGEFCIATGQRICVVFCNNFSIVGCSVCWRVQ
ncbi:hypothetical protein BaRGS_00002476, partial [Batillaria attramentaria]